MKRDCKTLICMTERESDRLNDLATTYRLSGFVTCKSDLVRLAISCLPVVPDFETLPVAFKVRASNTAL